MSSNKSNKKTTRNLEEYQINVMIIGNPANPPVKLTRDLLYYTPLKTSSTLSAQPYFTNKVKYPYKKLYELFYSSGGYSNIIHFFFSKQQFNFFLNKYADAPTNSDNDNNDYNIQLMIDLLFPTEYPVKKNHISSFDELILKKSPNISFKSEYVFNKPTFSYIQLNNTKYTIMKSVWLNDIYNHPQYFQLIEVYNKYVSWTDNAIPLIRSQINSNIINLQKKYFASDATDMDSSNYFKKTFFNDKNIETLKQKLKDIDVILKSSNTTSKTYDILQNTTDLQTLIGLLEDTNKKKLIQTLVEQPSVDEYYIYIDSIVKIINGIMNKNAVNININQSLYNKLVEMNKELKKIWLLNKILDEYITPKIINIFIENEDPDLIQLLKTEYPPYINVINQVNQLLPPITKSSNTVLENYIEQFAKKPKSNESQEFKTILENLYNKNISSIDAKLKESVLYTGVNYINLNKDADDKFEIYVSFDLIEGEYDENTMKSIECNYSGFYLGNKLTKLMNSSSDFDYKTDKIFLTKQELLMNINKNKNSPKNAENALLKPPPTSRGGKTRKNKYYNRKYYNRTSNNRKL